MVWKAVQWAFVSVGICLCFELVQCRFYNIGYQGFAVQANNIMGQSAWKTVGRHTNRDLESTLLESCPPTRRLTRQVLNQVYTGINSHHRQVANGNGNSRPVTRVTVTRNSDDDDNNIIIQHRIFGRKKRQASICSTTFDPQNWNYSPVQRSNNCYNYATNRRTGTFAQPGRGSGQRYTRTEAQNVYRATLRDGLTPLSRPDAGAECLIALVIWPGEDYHFYRLDSNGYWSHKSGRTEARNTDESRNSITDPRSADRGPYTVFAGWLGVGRNINIR